MMTIILPCTGKSTDILGDYPCTEEWHQSEDCIKNVVVLGITKISLAVNGLKLFFPFFVIFFSVSIAFVPKNPTS